MNDLRAKMAALLRANLPEGTLIELLIDVVARGLGSLGGRPRKGSAALQSAGLTHSESGVSEPVTKPETAGVSGSSLSLIPSGSLASPGQICSAEIEERTEPKYSPDFVQFWALYPRKVAKADAWRAWRKKKPPLGKIRAALAWQCNLPDWVKDDGEYIPYPQKYLNHARWLDEPPQRIGPVLTDRERKSVVASQAWLERRQNEE